MKIDLKTAGFEDLAKELDNLSNNVAKKYIRSAVNKAATLTVKEARKLAPKDTGLTKKSIKRVSIQSKTWNSYAAFIGAGKSIRSPKPTPTRGKNKGKPRYHSPYHILHILEHGFTHPGGQKIPGTYFMLRAFNQTSQAVIRKAIDELRRQIFQ